MWEQYWQGRGSPSEYDPGPPKNRRWSRLFAETPPSAAVAAAAQILRDL